MTQAELLKHPTFAAFLARWESDGTAPLAGADWLTEQDREAEAFAWQWCATEQRFGYGPQQTQDEWSVPKHQWAHGGIFPSRQEPFGWWERGVSETRPFGWTFSLGPLYRDTLPVPWHPMKRNRHDRMTFTSLRKSLVWLITNPMWNHLEPSYYADPLRNFQETI